MSRIKEILREAVIASRNESNLPPFDEETIQQILKLRFGFDVLFAKMIVQECIKIVENRQAEYEYLELYQSDAYKAKVLEDIVEEISDRLLMDD